jgi:predicted permease
MGILWENSFLTFLFVTVIIGGGAAYMSGRSLASKWRPISQPILYMLLLGAAVRFFHFALFNGTLLSTHYYVVDTAVLIGISLLGYRLTRVTQMVSQYRWLYVRSGPFFWREKKSA